MGKFMIKSSATISDQSPLVSIIIPTYNHAHLIKKALDSLLSQTYANWEAIVVNNFSADDTEKVVAGYSDNRIRLINFSNNGVIAASRNQGIQHSQGEFIAFLDSDDYWYPKKLEVSLDYLQNHSCDMVCSNEDLIENDVVIQTWYHGPDYRGTYNNLLMKGNCISTSTVILKKSCLDKVGIFQEDKKYITSEDYDLWLRIARDGYKIKFIDHVLGGHLKHMGSSSSSAIKHLAAVHAVVENHLSNYEHAGPIFKRKSLSVILYGAARQLCDQKNYNHSFEYFMKSLRSYPLRLKTYLGLGLLVKQYLFPTPERKNHD